MVSEQNLIIPGSALVYIMFGGIIRLELQQYLCLVPVD